MSTTDRSSDGSAERLPAVDGRAATAVWGAGLAVLTASTLLAYLAYAHLYLTVTADDRRPATDLPDLPVGWPLVLLAVLAVSLAPAAAAWRAAPADRIGAVAAALGAVALLGAAVQAGGAAYVVGLDLRPTERAVDAGVVTLHVVHGVATAFGVVAAAVVALEAVRLGSHPWVRTATAVVVVWWGWVVAAWAALALVLHGWTGWA